MKLIVFLFISLLQGNPTFLVKTNDLTIFTEVQSDNKTYITVIESLQDSVFTRRTSCYQVYEIIPVTDGRILKLGSNGTCFIPNDYNDKIGFIFEYLKEGLVYTTFDDVGIISKNNMSNAKFSNGK